MSLSLDDLRALARDGGPFHVTLCLAPHDRDGGGDRTRIMLDDARDAIRGALEGAGAHPENAEDVLAPFETWRAERGRGPEPGAVAAFLSPAGGRVEAVEAVRREGVWVDEGFRLSPVWPDPGRRVEAAALVCAEDGARLLRLSEGRLAPMESDAPESLEAFLGPKEIARAGGRMNQPGRQGDAFGETHRQERDEERARYAGAVARAAAKALAGSNLPLVIVADERMQGLIRSTIDYPWLCAEGETRHPAALGDDALAAAVTDAARPSLERIREEAEQAVEAALGRGDPASDDPQAVAEAAAEGRVDLLLFDPDPEPRSTDVADADADRAVVDVALRHALATGAEAHATPQARAPLRARFRY